MTAIINNCNSQAICQDKVNFTVKLIGTIITLKKYPRRLFLHAVYLIEEYCPAVIDFFVSILPLERECYDCGTVYNMRGDKLYSYYTSFLGYLDGLPECYQCRECEIAFERAVEESEAEYLSTAYLDICRCGDCPECAERWDLVEMSKEVSL